MKNVIQFHKLVLFHNNILHILLVHLSHDGQAKPKSESDILPKLKMWSLSTQSTVNSVNSPYLKL